MMKLLGFGAPFAAEGIRGALRRLRGSIDRIWGVAAPLMLA